MEDKQIVDLFWARSESAIQETEKKYGRYCQYIAYQILNRDSDAEEVVNDTWLKTWNTIPDNCPTGLKGYVGMICRQLAFNTYKRNQRQPGTQLMLALDELGECISYGDEIATMTENADLVDALNQFLWSQPQKTRNIFVRRYWYTSSIAEIASDFSMKESAVTMLLHRTRNKLKEYLESEGI